MKLTLEAYWRNSASQFRRVTGSSALWRSISSFEPRAIQIPPCSAMASRRRVNDGPATYLTFGTGRAAAIPRMNSAFSSSGRSFGGESWRLAGVDYYPDGSILLGGDWFDDITIDATD